MNWTSRQFKSPLNDINGRPTRGAHPCLKLSNGHHSDPGLIGQLLLGPIEQTPRGAALCWRDHGALNTTILLFLVNSFEIKRSLTNIDTALFVDYNRFCCISTVSGVQK